MPAESLGSQLNRTTAMTRQNGDQLLDLKGNAAREAVADPTVESSIEDRRVPARHEAIFYAVPVGILIVRFSDRRIVDVNPAYLAMNGLRRDQLIGFTLSEIGTWLDPAKIDEYAQRLQRNGRLDNVDIRIRTGSGSVEDRLGSAELVELDGETHAVLTVVDVTEKKRMEAAYAASEQRWRQLVESMPQMVWTADRTGLTDYLSPQWYRYTGLPESTTAPGVAPSALHPDDMRRVYGSWDDACKTGQTYRAEYRLRAADGSYRWFDSRGVPVRDADGQVVKWLGTATDIQTIKLAEEALARHGELLEAQVRARTAELADAATRMRLTMDSTADGILGVDAMQRITFVNRAGTQMLGYAEEELVGRSAHEMLLHSRSDGSPYPGNESPILLTLLTGRSARVDGEVFWRKNGQPLPIAYAAHALLENDRPVGAVVSFADVSVRRAAEMARDRALVEAQRLAQIRSEFLANMSHEIRTPLNAVLGFAQLGELEAADADGKTRYGHILDAGQHLLGVINDVLDYSKIESGKLALELRPVALDQVLERSAGVVRDLARAKGLAFRIERADGLPRTIVVDELRLTQVLINLMSNAVKFTASGEVVLGVSVLENGLRFSVSDTGLGMTSAQLTRAFEPFEQADGSMTRRFGGTGLGLAICKQLVGLMAGEIRAHSQPGRGSRFEIDLPLVSAGVDMDQHDISPPQESSPTAGRPTSVSRGDHAGRLAGVRVLAAEDNAGNRSVLEQLLKLEGASVLFAEDGVELVETLEKMTPQAFDVVLMDVQMPRMDGYQATLRLRQLSCDLPVIGVTAHAMAEERAKCLAAGMVEHIAKPIELNLLVRAILQHAVSARQLEATSGRASG